MATKREKPTIHPRLPWKWNHLLTGGDGSKQPQSVIDGEEAKLALGQLFEQFHVKTGDWQTLAFALAIEGGFIQVAKPTGPVPHWNEGLRLALWLSVRNWSLQNVLPVDRVLSDDAFLTYWQEHAGAAETPATLSTRYYETDRTGGLPALFKHLAADHDDPAAALTYAMEDQALMSRLLKNTFEDAKRIREDFILLRKISAK